MLTIPTLALIFWLIYNFYSGVHGFIQTRRGSAFGLTPHLYLNGSFVWGDAMIFGPFWLVITLMCWYSNDWLLFQLIVSVFWLVRSVGETIYWLNEQFAPHHLNDPKTLAFIHLVKNESIWFIYQILMQCMTVVSTILTLYFAAKWLPTL